MTSLFFVHIPKTAGTSFRVAAEKYFGSKNVVFDYGEDARETATIVQRLVYEEKDCWRLHQYLEAERKSMLCGHVRAKKYVGGFGAGNIVTFLRDPFQRLHSEYQHFVRHQNYKGSFRSFYTTRANQQSKMFDMVPAEAFGVLGLTERYEESLALINARYHLNLKPMKKNVGRKSLDQSHQVSEEDREELAALNKKDLQLYQRVTELFEIRQSLFDQGLPYVHARVLEVTPKRVAGWAFWEGEESDDPVDIDIRINGEVVASTQARSFCSAICHWGPPRGGYVGFGERIRAKKGDRLDFVVARTGQIFPPTPVSVRPKVSRKPAE